MTIGHPPQQPNPSTTNPYGSYFDISDIFILSIFFVIFFAFFSFYAIKGFGLIQVTPELEEPNFWDFSRGTFQFLLAGAAITLHAIAAAREYPETHAKRRKCFNDAACSAIAACWIVGGAVLVPVDGLAAPLPWQILAFPAALAVAAPIIQAHAPSNISFTLAYPVAPITTAWFLTGWLIHKLAYVDSALIDAPGPTLLDHAVSAVAWPAVPVIWFFTLPTIFPFTVLMALIGGACLFFKHRH